MLDWMRIPLSDGSISMNRLPPNWNNSTQFSDRVSKHSMLLTGWQWMTTNNFYRFFNNAGILKSRSQLLCLVLING